LEDMEESSLSMAFERREIFYDEFERYVKIAL
jgi:hypothetical protein